MVYIKAKNVGTIIKLYKKDSPGSMMSRGLVKMDLTGDILEFGGVLKIKSGEVGKTKITGTMRRDRDKNPTKLIKAKRW